MKNILLSLHFPRDISIEGGGTLLRDLALALLDHGKKPSLHAPIRDTNSSPCPVINSHESGHRSYQAYLNQLSRMLDDYDAIWTFEQSPSLGAFRIRRFPESHKIVRFIMSPYQTFSELISGPQSFQYLKHWVGKNALPARLRSPTGKHLVVSTDYQRRQLIGLGIDESTVQVIPFGVRRYEGQLPTMAEARAVYGLPKGPLITYIGHYSPIKGVPVLVRAFELLCKRMPEVRLALAWSGKGDESAKVHRMLDNPAIKDRVTTLGIVDPLLFLRASDVTVLPFVHSSFPHFPLVMIEAFAVGTPMVASDIGGISEMIHDRETGRLAPPNDPVELAEILENLLRDSAQLETISNNQLHSFDELYCADKTVDRFLQIL